ncbi:MAG: diguanylate cyclase [Anaerolineales bacterium]|nr:diguanylate cyclase [Anaerolineales bacterium]
MSELKISITILVSYVTLVLGIANVDTFQSSVIDFSPAFFVLVAIIVFSELMITGNLIRQGVKISYYTVILFWMIVYILAWAFYFGNDRPIQVQVIQLLLVAISAGLAYDVGKRIGQMDRTLEGLSSSAYPNRARDIKDARDLIAAEIARSRRYHHPLSILTFRLNRQRNRRTWKGHEPLEIDMLERFTIAKISQILSDLARNTDIVLRDKDGQFVLLCPETDTNNATNLAERISAAVDESLNTEINWGSAAFPDEALTFDDLLQTARRRLSSHTNDKIVIENLGTKENND